MSIKIAVLKSGENVISDVKELVSDDKTVGYLFEKPCLIDYDNGIFLTEESPSRKGQIQVTLVPWIMFTEDEKIPVRHDWVVTVVEPVSKIKELYEEKLNAESKTNSISQQGNSFIAD